VPSTKTHELIGANRQKGLAEKRKTMAYVVYLRVKVKAGRGEVTGLE